MQAPKGKIRKATTGEKSLIDIFCKRISVKTPKYLCYRTLYVLDLPSAKFKDVFDPSEKIIDFLEKHLDWKAYTIGTYIGLIGRKGFEPSLLLAHKLSRKCMNPVNCVIINEQGEKYFLYGRNVYQNNIVSYKKKGLVLVTNELREALGWGILEVEKRDNTNYGDRLVLRPVKDLGWYLRRGG